MNVKWTIFNKYEHLLMAGVIIVGLILARLMDTVMPVVSSAWLALCIVLCMFLYARGRHDWMQMRADMAAQKAAGSAADIDPEVLIRTLNSNMEKNISALRTLHGLTGADMAMIEKVQQATNKDRLDLYLQPIVNLGDRAPYFYEAFSRMRDESGALLRPVDYLAVVERANKIGFIDNMILLRSVQAVRALQKNNRSVIVFCNISPATLYDQNFFALFTQYLDTNQDLCDHLIFEFTYPAITLVDPTIGKSLEAISERGFAFSVDHVHRLDMNLSSLKRLNIRYVKAPASMLHSVIAGDGQLQQQFEVFRNELAEADIRIIAEKIESENQLNGISDLGIGLGQGNLFGVPRPAQAYLNPEPVKKAS